MTGGRSIRIAFSDFPGPTNTRAILALLSQDYAVEVVERDADYVFHSVFGSAFLDHPGDAVRIFFTGENVHADFNLTDYAFTYDWLEFGDRHFRAPNFILYDQWHDIVARGASAVADLSGKPDFCNFIYSNGNGDPIRDLFFHALHARQPVESFGAHLRNSERPIGAAYKGDWSAPKVEAQRSFKFSIAFENSASPGYTTEKIVHALAADTIPIYWGDPLAGRVFNPARIIDVGVLGIDAAIERVLALHDDDAACLDVLRQPFFAPAADLETLSDVALRGAMRAIIDRPKAEAIRRNFHFWGKIYEDRRRREVRADRLVARLSRLSRWLRFWRR